MGASARRVWALIVKEGYQLSRDRLTFAMVVMVPLLQLLLFGYSINTELRGVPVGWVVEGEPALSRQLLQDLQATQVVQFTERYDSPQQAEQALVHGEVRAVLLLGDQLWRRYQQQQPLGQWLVDGSDTTLSAALLALQHFPVDLTQPGTGQMAPATFTATLYYNPARRAPVNIVPGLLGVILTMTMVLFTAMAIVRERERGNLELLITTPMRPIELMLAKITPYIAVGLLQVAIILGLGRLLFDLPIHGSLTAIVGASLLFIAASLTLGLIISTFAKTQMQSMQMTVFVLMPSILLSGFMFPYEAMPVVAQWLAEGLPATHFIRLIRGVVLRGAELLSLWRDALFLLGFTVGGLAIAAQRFKKRLD